MSLTSLGFAVQKNILYVRFEQQHFKPKEIPAEPLFNVYYRLACPKPFNFRGFSGQIKFETSKITLEPKSQAKAIYADGTISEGMDFSGYENGTLNFAVLSSQALDTSNHVLFQFKALVRVAPGDSARLIVDYFDAVDSTIDTVIVENEPWYAFAVAYGDTEIVIPPKKRDITVSQDSIAIQQDSFKNAIVVLANTDSAKITSGIFSFTVDTSIVEVDTIEAANSGLTISPTITDNSTQVELSSVLPLQSGPILKVSLHAKARVDTVTTLLKNPNLQIANSDNLVNAIAYDFDSITVLGKAPKDTTNSVVAFEQSPEFRIKYEFSQIQIVAPELIGEQIRIFSQTGALVYTGSFEMATMAIPIRLSNGVYIGEISTRSGRYQTRFLVIH